MRKTVLVPVEKVLCDAHMAKDGTEVEASSTLSLGKSSWDLCLEHDVVFGRYLCDALGAPGGTDQPSVEPVVSHAVAEPEPEQPQDDVAEPEPTAEAVAEPESLPSVMVAGEVPGYDWDEVREAVRNLGYEVVGRADDSTVLLLLGERGERAGHKLQDAAERGLSVMDVRSPGRFKDAVCAGELVGGDPLPEPVKATRSGMSDREQNKVIRAWALVNGWPNLSPKGRLPVEARQAWQAAQGHAEGKAAAA
ncbi:hypothetical protein [Streptomyces caatingaensis]|uniref:Lsr2-like protein n=1 Tax=Streptomyces caatingaensis TaxID=1678637 RepID=A0A0K9XIJ9_9ACTN|nr:hypothetical protein [Streptomyces caatingaensis]KNB52881.1 hypothetical protein AC230_09625 [Streptomyces caatingaensis]